jgi:L-ribulokinase
MAIVAGVDFGTLSVRVSMVDSVCGMLASAVSEYPIHRRKDDPEYATQSHDDHMRALALATRHALKEAGIAGDQVQALALDTTGSTVIPVGEGLVPSRSFCTGCDTTPTTAASSSRLWSTATWLPPLFAESPIQNN